MSESLAGVTFLAFGNGSPDVFSTFAAMGSNSGSLAIGELIGAACFISAVVAGSMALVRPFHVARRSFVRDVGFFIIAAAFSMVVLADGELHVWECAAMIGLYLFYVVLVVSWHWYLTRQRRRYETELAARAHFHIPLSQELDLQERAVDDDPVAGETRSLLHDSGLDFDALERAAWPAWKDDEDDETRNRYFAEISEGMHVSRPTPSRRRPTLNVIRPSLVGALEFQSVLSSLQRSNNIRNRSPIRLGHYSNDSYQTRSHRPDNLSISSHPGTNMEPLADEQTANDRNRLRSVSMNAAPHLRIDTSVADNRELPYGNAEPQVPPQISLETAGELSRVDSSAILTTSPTSSGYPSRNQTPSPDGRQRSADHLTVPGDMFRAPDYQVSPQSIGVSPSSVSPGAISPISRGRIPQISISVEPDDDRNQAVPFPSYTDIPGSMSSTSRTSSLRLPAATLSSTSEVDPDNHFLEDLDRGSKRLRWWPTWFLPPPWLIMSTLFPTMYDWQAKNVLEKLLGIVAAPSVFLLTITVPVVEPHRSSSSDESSPNDSHEPTILIRLPEDSPELVPRSDELGNEQRNVERGSTRVRRSSLNQNRSRLDSEIPAAVPSYAAPAKEWHRWLVCIQLFTAPVFVVVVAWLTLDEDRSLRHLLIPILCSLGLSVVSVAFLCFGLRGPRHSQPPSTLRPLLAFVGFVVGISWIATIASEVVSLLKTLGVILNISDSLLGLTVFAVGNSLGDLVADITVARLGYPVMALSACFGGPMLNILLGIGIGGLYMTLNSKQNMSIVASDDISFGVAAAAASRTYKIVISKTLAISGATLLATLVGLLIIVPLNHWKMDRKIGWGLVILWTLSTVGNVIAEILG